MIKDWLPKLTIYQWVRQISKRYNHNALVSVRFSLYIAKGEAWIQADVDWSLSNCRGLFISPSNVILSLSPLLRLHNAPVAAMSTKISTFPVIKNTFAAPVSQHLRALRPHSWFPPARRRIFLQRPKRTPPTTTRSFTTSSLRRFADVNDSLELRQQDRESDQVDVCIVGGGMSGFYVPPV